MAAQNDIVSQMRQTLALADPDLDTSTGTTTRKILDAVAESIAESYLDIHLLSYQYDIDSKAGGDLDDFCALFGIVRYGAKRATGTVTFVRDAAAANSVLLIPANTIVSTETAPQITAMTVTPAFMDIGARSATVPVQAVDGGPLGNVGASTLTRLVSPLTGISQVANVNALSGGAPVETDQALQTRWKQTVFRNLAGTEQMYLGVALADGLSNDPGCTRANVVGAAKTRREQVQIIGGVATSTADDVAFVYPNTVTLGTDIDAGVVNAPGLDYTFDTNSTPPVVHNNGGLTEGGIYDLVYEYVPEASRNDPANGITNRIDIWCNGVRVASATQTVIFGTSLRFTATATDALAAAKFVRPDGTPPALNNVFLPLAYGPVLTLPSTLVMNVAGVPQTFAQVTPENPFGTVDNTDPAHPIIYAYDIVHEDAPVGWSPTSRFGIEWDQANLPDNAQAVVVGTDGDYTYNAVPFDIQTAVDNWRLIGTDAKVHQAKLQYLRFNLVLVTDPKVARDIVFANVRQALADYCDTLGFDAIVAANEALRAVLNANGVLNARFLAGSDYPGPWNYADRNDFATGIQRIVNNAVVETYVDNSGRPFDVSFGDAELPIFNDIGGGSNPDEPVVRAQNTFGSV